MNVLLITVDCLRRDRCGIYGHHHDTTPTMDALARKGYVFDEAYATGPVTTESFPGILAGRLSAQCVAGETLYQKRIPEGEPTIATHLRDAGYDTIGVISNPRIGCHVDTDRGFETFWNLRTGGGSDKVEDDGSGSLLPNLQVGERLYQLREEMREHDSVPYRYELPFLGFRSYQYLTGWPSVRGEKVVDSFLEGLSEVSSPFFGWTHLMDVHGPIHPKTVEEGGLVSDGLFSQFRSHARRVSDVYDAQTEGRYDSAVRYVDDQIGRIVDWLQSEGLWEETTLIVTADHGDALYDRGIYGHPQHYTFDELLSVPLVVRMPGEDGERISRPFSLGWLHGVISEVCELGDIGAPMSSELSWNATTSPIDEREVLLADSISPDGHSVVARREGEKRVVHSDGLEFLNRGPQKSGAYHITRDPKERVPGESKDGLYKRASEVMVAPEEIESAASTEIDQVTEDRLKQLGYAE